jgi:DNA polymerase-3 subunit beta
VKLSCLKENLAKGLSVVGRAVATRLTSSVLTSVKLSTDRGRLKLSATDLEIGINCWIGAEVEEEGATTVPTRSDNDGGQPNRTITTTPFWGSRGDEESRKMHLVRREMNDTLDIPFLL